MKVEINPEEYHMSKASAKELCVASVYILYGKVEAIKVLRSLEGGPQGEEIPLGVAKTAVETKFPSGEESVKGLLGAHAAFIEFERKGYEDDNKHGAKVINWD